jgi:uncharacterized protein YpbB
MVAENNFMILDSNNALLTSLAAINICVASELHICSTEIQILLQTLFDVRHGTPQYVPVQNLNSIVDNVRHFISATVRVCSISNGRD